MQITLCNFRRSASGKRAIWRARSGWLKKASDTRNRRTGIQSARRYF
jgi:hypothetical protein